MTRFISIVVALWALFCIPAVCAIGVLEHPCECAHETSCSHEDSCPSDPCANGTLMRTLDGTLELVALLGFDPGVRAHDVILLPAGAGAPALPRETGILPTELCEPGPHVPLLL